MLSDTKENWPYYSAALVKIQTDFVRELPASVKDLIRLVKYWHKTFISQTGGEHLLPYYLLELLTIHAWENANRPEEFDMRIGFKAVMEVLQNNRSLHVSWDRYFKRDLIPSRYIHEVFKTSFPRIKGAVFYTLEDHRRTGRGGEGGCSPPPNFGQLRFFGQHEKIWAKPVFKDVCMFLLLF